MFSDVLMYSLSTVRPEVVLNPVSINVTRIEDSIILSCSATGFPAPSIIWHHNDTAIIPMERISTNTSSSHFQTNSTININNSMTNDTGTYYCNITSSIGDFGPINSSIALVLVQGQCASTHCIRYTGICDD